MNREVHVRFCEGMGVKFPRATRPLIHTFDSSKDTTTCGCWPEMLRVRIKVCHMQFFTELVGLHFIMLRYQSVLKCF